MQTTTTTHENHASYDPKFFTSLFAIEDRHFWFQARNQVIASVMQKLVAPLSPGYRVLEIGCGTGNTLRVLEQVCTQGMVVGMDLFQEGLHFARQRVTCSLIQGDMHHPPFEDGFDIVCLFDVLEHLPDDVQVLHDLYTMLAPGGTLFLTVPAHRSLWSYFDEAACHYRRYEPLEMTHKLTTTGYHIVSQTHYMASILPLVWGGRRLAALTKRKQPDKRKNIYELTQNELRLVPVINDVLAWALAQEGHVIARDIRIPFGTSLLVVARKDQK